MLGDSSVVLPARILDGLSTSVLLLGPDLDVLRLNSAAEDLLGISQNRAANHPVAELFVDGRAFLDVLERARQDGQPYTRREVEVAFRLDQTEPNAVDFKVTPIGQPKGSRQYLVEITDATRRVRISRENALMVQYGASRALVRQMAHEIKNPLGGLRGAAQLLQKELTDPELREYTGIIISEADRLAALVDTMLGPDQPLRTAPVNIHEILQHVLQVLSTDPASGVDIAQDFDPSLPPVELDRDQMIQAILNIVTNATEAVDGNGRVVVRTRAENQCTIGDTVHRVVAKVEIEDNGPGVPDELRDTLFYPMVTGRPDGTGLGLALAQELVNRHGGLIEYDSRPGCTTFRIMLPIGGDAGGDGKF